MEMERLFLFFVVRVAEPLHPRVSVLVVTHFFKECSHDG